MRRQIIGWTLGPLALVFVGTGAGCRRESPFVEAALSDPVTTGSEGNEIVWWAEHRANQQGSNDTRVIMCRRGMRPTCVRMTVEDVVDR